MTTSRRSAFAALASAFASAAAFAGTAMAQESSSQVSGDAPFHADNGIAMLPAQSALATEVHFFHNAVLMPIITVISVFVLLLLVWVVFRYNAKANPVPKKFSHNTLIEIIWTGVPILILLYIALFSFDLLYKEDVTPDGKRAVIAADGATTEFAIANDFASPKRMATRLEHVQVFVTTGGERAKLSKRSYDVAGLGEPEVTVTLSDAPAAGSTVEIHAGRTLVGRGDNREIALAPTMTLKVNGYQWGWSYAYPDFGDFEYASNMLPEEKTSERLYRLAVDNNVVVPVGETIRVTTTASDVIHSWAMPNFTLKIDAVPGRINETWFKADREGLFYGQCSEICGVKHSFMPIAVEVVSREKFEAWVDEQRAFAGMEPMFKENLERYAAARQEPKE
ncbi:MAG: cytochrome c oxidase subunit II transmembrane domain-containing protein [Pseudomonadota bacterium]